MSGSARKLRTTRFLIRLNRLGKRLFGRETTVYVDQRVGEYRGYWSGAAKHLSATLTDLAEDVWEVRLGDRCTRIANYVTEADDPVTLHLAGDKPYCLHVAAELGLPVAFIGEYTLENWDQLAKEFDTSNDPLVVKPAAGSSSGLGITTQITTRKEFERAVVLASLYHPSILLERSVPAESVRLLFLNGEMIHAVRRRGVRVVGDGQSTVRQLLAAEHATLIEDPLAIRTLASQDLSLDSVIAEAHEIVARAIDQSSAEKTELRTVYNETITDLVCDELRDQVSALVRTLRCRFVGVDLLTNDPTVSLERSGGVFLEVNTTPGIHHHYQTPEEHEHHPVAVKVLDYLLTHAHAVSSGPVGAGVYDYNRPEGTIRG